MEEKRLDKGRRWERKRQVNLLSSLGFARLFQTTLVVAAHMHKFKIGTNETLSRKITNENYF